MSLSFKIIEKENLADVIPLVYKLNEEKISKTILMQRFKEMQVQNYQCAGVYDADLLVGVAGMWFFTRHYSGKSMELDHVYINEAYRNQGLGKKFMSWINDYALSKNVETIELNTYVQNFASHKFYFNEGFKILGYHFLKKF
ncbi:GNAT family N-acetyltransferase [Lacinutrix sp. C3R15]|uniref:GNAT family N-acetyltransferase n=1 Tax=Flavobacteriaceae TaxID=49546 RepID=UPI001C0857DF|nr:MULTISPECIES: GNAT family N-acetyltransferase [Flavobacteriaceae]MBU2939293.1 GNAT family N-acetyltransferase [Lacinutrix sp. C3R15]MDO6622608.1 GNAT family N-acetyltransferase [Oceanihabitans sp. 1_MG-2023]